MDEIKLLLFIGISGMLLLFSSFLLIFVVAQRKKYQLQRRIQLLREDQSNQLIEAAIRSEEKERHRIAEALHDEVGAYLSSAKLYLQAMNVKGNDQQDQLFQKGKNLLNEAIDKVRNISHNLHSGILQQLGLVSAIRHFAEQLMLDTHLQITVALDDALTVPNPEYRVSIYRLIQELVNNIIKHSGASHITISSGYRDQMLTFTIVHDGNGLEQDRFNELRFSGTGLGIKNIQTRMILLKGKIFFFKEGHNYHTQIDIPKKATQHD